MLRYLGAMAGVALFFAITSPFNAVTYLPILGRWAYWTFLIGITAVTLALSKRLLGKRFSPWTVAFLAAIAATPLVLLAILSIQVLIGYPVAKSFWLSLTGSIWVINLALTLVQEAVVGSPVPTPTSVDLSGPLREKLPLGVRDEDILAISAQDHYVTVQLPSGDHLIHMRFGDAVALMAGIDGLQVHRSWWVAKAAVKTIERSGRQWEVALANGQVAPVSRAGASRLKEAGWR